MQQPQYGYMPPQPMNGGGQMQSGRREEQFSSQATVFILKDKTWREQSQGTVQFVFDLNTYALRLIIAPGTAEAMDRRLRPRIRSKGPRAYVVRAQAPNNGEDSILAVRFEREEDSQNFRKFVEKRDVDNNNTQSSSHQANNQKMDAQQAPPNANNGPYPQNYATNYQAMGGGAGNMMGGYGNKAPNGAYDYGYQGGQRGDYNNGYYPSPSPQTGYSQNQDYHTPSTLVNPATTPHNVSTHQSMYSNQANGAYGNQNVSNGSGLVHRPNSSNQWGNGASGPSGYGNGNVVNPNGNQNGNNNGNNVETDNVPEGAQGGYPNQTDASHARPNYKQNSMSGKANVTNTQASNTNTNDAPAASVNVLKLTESNLEQHNRVFAESSMASKRKNVRDIILEQLQWQREHGIAH